MFECAFESKAEVKAHAWNMLMVVVSKRVRINMVRRFSLCLNERLSVRRSNLSANSVTLWRCPKYPSSGINERPREKLKYMSFPSTETTWGNNILYTPSPTWAFPVKSRRMSGDKYGNDKGTRLQVPASSLARSSLSASVRALIKNWCGTRADVHHATCRSSAQKRTMDGSQQLEWAVCQLQDTEEHNMLQK